ncbi:MAG: rRNA maturation RNase YbeY [Pseudonocardiaceae bacterium]
MSPLSPLGPDEALVGVTLNPVPMDHRPGCADDIEVFVADEQSDDPIDPLRWSKLAHQVVVAQGVKGEAELSLLFVDEAAISELNQRFLGKTGPTDVLAFPIDEDVVLLGPRSADSLGPGPSPDVSPSDAPSLLGDVVICPAVARRNAPDHAGTYEDELALLIVHGILHLLGMDHMESEEAEVMEARERELLALFNAPAAGSTQ